ncbi:MAG: sensor histidine kinase [Flavobacteriaceae bacterium]
MDNFRSNSRWIIILVSFVIISLILWNTYVFFNNFKNEERIKMENWSAAQKEISQTSDLDDDIGELPLKIIRSNSTTPMIKVDADGNVEYNNINSVKANDSLYIQSLINKFKTENDPIEIIYNGKIYATLYYGNSPLLNKLKYYPLALLLIILLFSFVVYFFYRSNISADQNKLWTGMAKETAHQIGTPLSSLVGWTEILKSEKVNQDYVKEIEKDIKRLEIITSRFSKIGSLPILKPHNIVEETSKTIDYLKSRLSDKVIFSFVKNTENIQVNLDPELYSWSIENLIKNGIDAMKGKGMLTIEITQKNNQVKTIISDTGKGIPKNQFQNIFEPGFTTKKRGWGLGLSLSKRITEDYHKGKIKVLNSELEKGTSIQISLSTIS